MMMLQGRLLLVLMLNNWYYLNLKFNYNSECVNTTCLVTFLKVYYGLIKNNYDAQMYKFVTKFMFYKMIYLGLSYQIVIKLLTG